MHWFGSHTFFRNHHTTTGLCCAGALTLITLFFSQPVQSQAFPTKPLRILIGAAPGGGLDATARAMQLALLTMRGEMGYPTALSAKTWGFSDVLYNGRPLKVTRPYGSHVIENVQFKIAYPAQRHSQTAAECAVRLHPLVKDRLDDIACVELTTHKPALLKIVVDGPLPNFAARDHCLQYVAAIGLIFGRLTAEDYEDHIAVDPRIDPLRAKTVVYEDKRYSSGFLDPKLRSNANAICVHFKDGSSTKRMEVEFAAGHPRRLRKARVDVPQPGLDKGRADIAGRLVRQQRPERSGRNARVAHGLHDEVDIGRAITYLRQRGDMAILLVEQYLDFAHELADDFAVMDRGEVVMSGTRETFDADAVRKHMTV